MDGEEGGQKGGKGPMRVFFKWIYRREKNQEKHLNCEQWVLFFFFGGEETEKIAGDEGSFFKNRSTLLFRWKFFK